MDLSPTLAHLVKDSPLSSATDLGAITRHITSLFQNVLEGRHSSTETFATLHAFTNRAAEQVAQQGLHLLLSPLGRELRKHSSRALEDPHTTHHITYLTARANENNTFGCDLVRTGQRRFRTLVVEDGLLDEAGAAQRLIAKILECDEMIMDEPAKPLAYELDTWLNFTKWHAVLSRLKHDMLRTYEFARYPEPDDTRLRRLLRAWDMVKGRALDTLEDVDHKDALKWWVSAKNEVACQNPFELPQSAKTVDKYSRMWEQFLCYMVQTVPSLGDKEAVTVDGDNNCESTETGVEYTREQREAIENIHDALDDDYSDVGLAALASDVMRLCRLVITQDLSTKKLYDSPLMHYLAVRGIDEKAECFRRPMEYTSILAGVLWIVRLLALEMVIPLRAWLELGIPGKAEIASVRESIKSFRLAHLVEGSFSPVSSILTQLAKGKKDNSVHRSPSNIHWAEDKETIYFVGRPVELAKIGPMCNALLEELKESMFTLAFEEALPTIDLGRVVDSTAWNQQFRKANYLSSFSYRYTLIAKTSSSSFYRKARKIV